MKRKIDLFWYWFIFVVAFVLCFFVVNDKKINAYHLNENGNVVSDNLININGTWSSGYVENNKLYIRVIGGNGAYSIYGEKFPVSYLDYYSFIATYEKGDSSRFVLQCYSSTDVKIQNCATGVGLNSYLAAYGGQWADLPVSFQITNNDVSYIQIGLVGLDNDTVVGNYYSYENIQLIKGQDNFVYEPYGIWYSESNLNIEKEISYENGYNDGYNNGLVDNNTIPSIYINKSDLTYNISIGSSLVAQSVSITDRIINLNATLNFTELLNYNFTNSTPVQTMYSYVDLITKFNVNDTLTINFTDVSSITDFQSKFFILFGDSSCFDNSCGTSVYLTYNDIVSNDNKIILKNINPNLTVDTIDTFTMTYYYNGFNLYGVSSIINDTLYGSGTSSQYDLGYSVGYIVGESNGKVIGEEIGYNKGYDVGYTKASQVVSDPGNNTLVGMVSVLMGMPVNMLVSIYDFEFLGINLAEFFLSLVTLLISIWLIRKLL